ncbi:HopJ type III effector protein [Hirschia litorea]|uniref:HopJ type III effector protein n=1 Tax=Hirschia litorea TaxID=1199156 RepID=A0ABW2IK28_9PROT
MTNFSSAQKEFLADLTKPDFMFETTLSFIETWYDFTPTAFKNGRVENSASENQGSCKVFALQHLLNLTTEQTLLAFGQHYRDVLTTPNAENHFNLRTVVKSNSVDVEFENCPLKRK